MSSVAPRALVTGASSGIGRALAVELVDRGYQLVLVARNEAALVALHAELSMRTRSQEPAHEVLVAALDESSGLDIVTARLRDIRRPVDVLVHSAGVGLPPGGYLGNSIHASEAVNRLGVDALTQLAHAALPGMLERDRGGLLTVGSIAGCLPGSAAITYSAAKAWALAFGQGLNQLTRGTGVTSTVVAPGFVRSGFHESAGLSTSGIHSFMWCTPEQVARAAVVAFERRRALVVPGAVWKALYGAYRLAPGTWSRSAFARYMAWTARRAT